MKKKRLLIPTVCVMAVSAMMLSCGSKTNNDNQASEDSLAAAAAAADSIAAAEALWTADSQRLAKQKTPDLEYNELHGPVMTVTYSDPVQRFDYSRDGRLLLVDGYDPFTETQVEMERMCLKRNKNGEICSYIMYESSEDYEWKDGRIAVIDGGGEGYEWHVTMEYDEKGLLRAKKGKQQYEDGSEQETINNQFMYLDFDDYGNWTRRKVDGAIQKRTIKYYTITRPSGNADAFNPIVRTYNFNGSIGGEKDCPMQIGKDNGYYVVKSGKKKLVFANYDVKTGELILDAFKMDRNEYIGRFTGKVTGKNYKGSFVNTKGGKASFSLTMVD